MPSSLRTRFALGRERRRQVFRLNQKLQNGGLGLLEKRRQANKVKACGIGEGRPLCRLAFQERFLPMRRMGAIASRFPGAGGRPLCRRREERHETLLVTPVQQKPNSDLIQAPGRSSSRRGGVRPQRANWLVSSTTCKEW